MEDFLRNAFYEEAEELFGAIEGYLLDIERQGLTRERLDTLFRHMHTLKGSSATMGLGDMARLTHSLEDTLGRIREGNEVFGPETADLMLSSLDALKVRIEKHRCNEDYEIDVSRYIKEVQEDAQVPQKTGAMQIRDTDRIEMLEGMGPADQAYLIEITLHSDCLLKGARLMIIANALAEDGKIARTSWEHLELAAITGDTFRIQYVSSASGKEIELKLQELTDVVKAQVEGLDLSRPSKTPQEGQAQAQTIIRVNITKLDKLMNAVEALAVDKERMKAQTVQLFSKYPELTEDAAAKTLLELVAHMDVLADEMQDLVLSTRMYTLQQVFQRFPRMVRDLTVKQGKDIQLIMEGEDTELDRSIVEKIIDPLTHILRNSVDHGIEPPAERKLAGKPAEAVLRLIAGQEENYVFIRVEDDGRGIRPEVLKESALRRGLLTQEQLDHMTEQEVLEIIFMPGFSTAQTVTDVSGRGVGMSVVKENLEAIGGLIAMENRVGRGLAVILKIPLTLAILQTQLLRTGQHTFAVPLLVIQEIVRIKQADLQQHLKPGPKGMRLHWRGEALPILPLGPAYGMEQTLGTQDFYGILAEFSGRRTLFQTDAVLGQQQVVVKSMERYIGPGRVLGDIKGISGTAVLGDGDIAFVLDLQYLASPA